MQNLNEKNRPCIANVELCAQSNVSIKKLRYYHNIDLLKAQVSKTGDYHLYTEDDYETLQKILFLEDLDFNPAQITAIVQANNDNTSDTLVCLYAHKQTLLKQSRQLQSSKDLLDLVIDEYVEHKAINWPAFFKHKYVVDKDKTRTLWWKALKLSVENKTHLLVCQDKLKTIFGLDKDGYDKLWRGVWTAVKNNHSEDPAEEIGQFLGTQAIAILQLFYGGNTQLIWNVYFACTKQKYTLMKGMTQDAMLWIGQALYTHNLAKW